MGDAEILRRFVLRARRVRAHSLVQEWDELIRYARGEFQGRLDVTGRMIVTRTLPVDEEVFESLASRLRPLTVKSELIYYDKVFRAIDRALGSEGVDESRSKLLDLWREWTAAEIQGTQTQAYALQMAWLDGAEPTDLVSDTQLAAAWLYADLVHADAQGPKQAALVFPLGERYAAAVRLFSHLAALTVATLLLVESLREAGVMDIDASAWADDVVVRTSELSEEARVYFAPVGSPVPPIHEPLATSQQWNIFTVTDLLRQDQANQVRVVLRDESGKIIASHEAALSRRNMTDTSVECDVMVAGSVVFTFCFDRQGDQVNGAHLLRSDVIESTNELKLASTSFLLRQHRAKTVAFEFRDTCVVTVEPSALADDVALELEVAEQTVGDIVAIERLSGRAFGVCNGQYDDRDRVRLRWARLVWEGQITYAMRGPVTVTATEGNQPALIVVAAGILNVGGADVPLLQTFIRHPRMTATEAGAVPAAGPEAKAYRMEPPEGERFLAWSPQRVQLDSDDDLVVTAAWNLIGIDEETFGY